MKKSIYCCIIKDILKNNIYFSNLTDDIFKYLIILCIQYIEFNKIIWIMENLFWKLFGIIQYKYLNIKFKTYSNVCTVWSGVMVILKGTYGIGKIIENFNSVSVVIL